jgi:hypothetical protein
MEGESARTGRRFERNRVRVKRPKRAFRQMHASAGPARIGGIDP